MPARSVRAHSVAGALTVGAGLVHATAAGAHVGDATVARLFALTAISQVVLGAAMAGRPSPPTLLAGAVLNVAVATAWLGSRTTGLPLVEALGEPEAVGLQDVIATVMEVVAASVAVLALRVRPAEASRAPALLSPALVLALVPALVAMAAPHTHAGGDDHHDTASELAADPMFKGADTSHASEKQLEAARRLIESTRGAVTARFPDEAAVTAAGYRSIGDGRQVGSYEHFLRADYLVDGQELDPERVESIVLQRTATGKRVVSAMYILELGKTMADVPDVAGELTTWHDHQNLCWDRTGTRLAGLLLNGQCVPGGTFRATPPMLHVWLEDHPCGPFAGIEGHGVGCAH